MVDLRRLFSRVRTCEIGSDARATDVQTQQIGFPLDVTEEFVLRRIRIVREIVGSQIHGLESDLGTVLQQFIQCHGSIAESPVEGICIQADLDARASYPLDGPLSD
jgi:hypothetical protein